MKKVYKRVVQENGIITFYGSNRYVELKNLYRFEDSSFVHYGRRYRLSQFIRVKNNPCFGNAPEWMQEFDGYMSDSFFSGVVVKFSDDGEGIKAFTYIS